MVFRNSGVRRLAAALDFNQSSGDLVPRHLISGFGGLSRVGFVAETKSRFKVSSSSVQVPRRPLTY
jgi:hypothetical protein